MSDADLVKELRQQARNRTERFGDGSESVTAEWRAADRVEALAAEVERAERIASEWKYMADRRRDVCQQAIDQMKASESRAESAERALAEAVEIMRPFLNVRDQFPESAKLILKKVSDLATINLTVTKGQFRAARDFITAQEKEKGK